MIANNWKDMPEGKEKYQMYLASREWAEKRDVVRRRSGGVCERCQWNKAENVHHMTYIRKYKEEPTDLVHWCRACHEHEHNKIGEDPINSVPFHIGRQVINSVYLAGKISGTDWRDGIADDWSNEHSTTGSELYHAVPSQHDYGGHATRLESKEGILFLDHWPVAKNHIKVPGRDKKLDFTGPYWNSNVSQNYGGHCSNGWVYRPYKHSHDTGYCTREIVNLCYGAISRSDLVFAWVDSSDAHGTLQEVGYAHGIRSDRKPHTVAAFESLELMREMWFLAESVNFSFVAPSAKEAWEKFCKAVTESYGRWHAIRRKLGPKISNNARLDAEVRAYYQKEYDEAEESEKDLAANFWETDPYEWRPPATWPQERLKDS